MTQELEIRTTKFTFLFVWLLIAGIFTKFFLASSTAFAIASETSLDFPNP
jgi:hypothetical protein